MLVSTTPSAFKKVQRTSKEKLSVQEQRSTMVQKLTREYAHPFQVFSKNVSAEEHSFCAFGVCLVAANAARPSLM